MAGTPVKKTALKVQCGSCLIVVNVPFDLVEHLLTVGQFTCPKCHKMQSINMTKESKQDVWAKVRRMAGTRDANVGAAALRDSRPHQGPGGGGAGSQVPGMMGMLERGRSQGLSLTAPQGGAFAAMFNNMVDDGDDEAEDEDNGATFSTYRPRRLEYGVSHPDPIVESASMAAVDPPTVTYVPQIRATLADTGLLSCVQLEAIVYACQRHSHMLPNNTRAGFFVGDGAGVGKGRTLAGLVVENWMLGRRRHVWLSVATDLKLDAERDLADCGAAHIPVYHLNKIPYGKKDAMHATHPEGVMFLTYSSLIAANDRGQSRLEQLLKWCGPDFDGLIMFDECHKAKNLMPEQGTQPTRTGLKALEIQELLPNARVVYCSATGASSARNMAYMVRLGLWGNGLAFATFQEFLSAVQSRGLGTLQIVAMEMKARGMYVSRMLSFEGAEFNLVKVPLPAEIFKMYRDACALWSSIRVAMMHAIEVLEGVGIVPNKMLWRQYWATHQRFFRYICLAAKVPQVLMLTKKGLAEGQSVIIGLQSTGEARTSDVVAEKGNILDDFVSGPRELLLKLVHDWFPLPGGCEAQQRAAAKKGAEAELKSPGGKASCTPPKCRTACKRKRLAMCRNAPEADAPESNGRSSIFCDLTLEGDTADDSAACSREPSCLGGSLGASLSLQDDMSPSEPSSLPRCCAGEAPPSRQPGRSAAGAPCNQRKMSELNGHSCAAQRSSGALQGESFGGPVNGRCSAARSAARQDLKKAKVERAAASALATLSSGRALAELDVFDVTDATSADTVGGAASLAVESDTEGTDSDAGKGDTPEIGKSNRTPRYSGLCPKPIEDMLYKVRADLKQLITSGTFPTNPLDALIDELGGPEHVAEMTGRKARLVRKGERVQYENRNASGAAGCSLEMINIVEKQAFLDGTKRVAIISEAASAGISLHAERRQKNQQRRLHITMEMPWSAERAVQQFGRSHRANQSSAPQYCLLFTDLGGEMRFAAAVARRLLNMGALTQGDRRARHIGLKTGDLNYDSPWGRHALQSMYQSVLEERACPIAQADIPACNANDTGLQFRSSFEFFTRARAALLDAGVFRPRDDLTAVDVEALVKTLACGVGEVGVEDAFRGDVPRFLNRLLGIEPVMQRHIFDFFQTLTEQTVQHMKQDGTYDTGVVDIQATSIKPACPPEVVHRDPHSGATTLHHVLQVDRGMSFEHALKLLRDHRPATVMLADDDSAADGVADGGADGSASARAADPSSASSSAAASGFWVSAESGRGSHRSVLLALDMPGSLPPSARIFRPKIGASCRSMKISELKMKMSPCATPAAAQADWDRLYEGSADVGSARIKHVSLLTGSILPIWKHLENNLRHCHLKSERRLKVVKVTTAEAFPQLLAGVVLPESISQVVLQDIRQREPEPEQRPDSRAAHEHHEPHGCYPGLL